MDLSISDQKLLVVTHYDSIINQIDLNCEQILCDSEGFFNDSQKEIIHSTRLKLIEELKEAETENLAQFELNFDSNNPILEKVLNPIYIGLLCACPCKKTLGFVVISDVYYNSKQNKDLVDFIRESAHENEFSFHSKPYVFNKVIKRFSSLKILSLKIDFIFLGNLRNLSIFMFCEIRF
jgi:hypothetical protein